MSRWGQPDSFVLLGGRACRLQVLDPDLAFELERQIVDRLGEDLCLTLATTSTVTKAIGEVVNANATMSAAVAAVRQLGQIVQDMLTLPDLDGQWVIDVMERAIFDRLEVEGERVGSWHEWGRLGFSPIAKWQALAAQLTQTYGPLWSRSPYSAGARSVNNYGVPVPTASKTVQWAAALASSGYVGSVDEVLRSWTPGRMIDLVEIAAADCERQRRASAAASAGAG